MCLSNKDISIYLSKYISIINNMKKDDHQYMFIEMDNFTFCDNFFKKTVLHLEPDTIFYLFFTSLNLFYVCSYKSTSINVSF